MRWLEAVHGDPELQDLMRSTARNLMFTVAGLYLLWHIIATVGYSRLFSPSLWNISLYMLVLILMTLRLIERHYFTAQFVWLGGLAGAILLAYFIYLRPEILFLLIALPLITIVTLGVPATIGVVFFATGLTAIIVSSYGLSGFYITGVFLGGAFTAIFGWGVASNLLDALNAASYHYNEARRLLEETQNHRAEISRMLKDRNQVNYQLERMNEMLTFARTQADEARENRNRFMLAVSHELRSPLNFIIGFSDLMINAPETYAPREHWPPGLYEDVQEIYTSSRHLMRLINDILDMGKIDAHQLSLYREKGQLDQIIADVQAMLANAFAQKGIDLRIELPASLSPVFVDTTRIRQVLLNLLNNGLRFTDTGSVTLRVEQHERELFVSVTDTGMGIAPEDLPRVFDEFRQVGEENWRRRTGSGLGLYISRQFVELHGGRMGVESTPGQGACFHFTIPLSSSTYEGSISSFPNRPDESTNAPVLLITPHPEDAAALRHSLEGYVIQTVKDTAEAKQKTDDLFPRAVLVASEAGSIAPETLPYDLPVVRFHIPRAIQRPENLHAQLVKPVSRKMLLNTLHSLAPETRRLLIIDDDPAMIRFVTQSFRASTRGQADGSYTLLSAFNGARAFELLRAHPVDAILLDLELPDINGWEWLKQLQNEAAFRHIPVVIISAQDVLEINLLPGPSALELTLRRPLQMTELGQVIKSVLENILPQYPQEKDDPNLPEPDQ